MIIQENDFRLTPVSDNSTLFDLELLYTINSKDKKRDEFKIVAYGITLDYAIRQIIQYRLSKKYAVLDLKKYLEEFRNEFSEIKKLCYTEENSQKLPLCLSMK